MPIQFSYLTCPKWRRFTLAAIIANAAISNNQTVKFKTILFLGIVTILNSCSGQSNTKSNNSSTKFQNSIFSFQKTSGEEVKELGKNIMIVYQDKKNNYWFGSWENGVYKYDGKTILHFTVDAGLSHNRIDEIIEDKLGNIFFNTPNGINKYDGEFFTKLPLSRKTNQWKLEPDDLWFRCTNDSGQAYRYDGNFLYRLSLPKTKIGEEFIVKNPSNTYNPYMIYSIYKDSKGYIWFGGAIFGLCRYDGKTFDWITEVDVTELHNGPSNGVRSMTEDKDGKFWFNTMFRYDIYGSENQQNNNTINQTFNYKREKGIGSLDGKIDGNLNEYLSITTDNKNDIWIATYRNGVWKYDGENITHYSARFENKDITVFSIYKDNKGDLWLGTPENGAFKFNGKSFEKFDPK